MTGARTYRKLGVYVAVVLALAFGVLLLANRQAVASQLTQWKLLPQPERFTELYFTRHASLPTAYIAGEQQTVRFTVHNRERQPVTYRYVIAQYDRLLERSVQLASGTVALDHNRSRQLSVPVVLQNAGPRSAVRVSLTHQQQFIQYWVVDPSQSRNITKEGSE